jgi:hypothetical protein
LFHRLQEARMSITDELIEHDATYAVGFTRELA